MSTKRILHYELIDEVGRGTIGVVWRAWDTRLHRYVALKLLRLRSVDRAEEEALAEAQCAASVDHPHVVKVYAAGVVDSEGLFFIDSQLVGDPVGTSDDPQAVNVGVSLDRAVSERAATPRQIAAWIRDVARGVAAAHARGVVHQDIKPANIILTPSGRAMLTDFGLSRVSPMIHGQADRPVEERFIAPEQRREDGQGTPLADIYSLGATLMMLAAARAREVPATLFAICRHATAFEPAERYPSAAAFAEDLDAWLGHRPVSVRPRDWAATSILTVRRRPVATGLLVAAFLVIVLGTAGFAFSLMEERANLQSTLAVYDRMTHVTRLRRLIQDEKRLWPLSEERVPAMRTWLAEAEELLDWLPVHEEAVERLRERGEEYVDDPEKDFSLRSLAHPTPVATRWRFDDPVDRWRHEVLSKLVDALGQLKPLIGSVEKRLDFSAKLRKTSILDHADVWRECLDDLRESGRYEDIDLQPQSGLVPLGRNKHGFWEFWHVATGERPRWEGDPLAGEARLDGRSGLVFVLLPGDTYLKGMQDTDPDAPNFVGIPNVVVELPGSVRSVTVGSLFVSKYEVTQRQWQNVLGRNPSHFWDGWLHNTMEMHPINVLHPVEFVSAYECARMLYHVGLDFPTDDEWEYFARGGTTTMWWTGSDWDEAWKAGNLADMSYKQTGYWKWKNDRKVNDGYPLHAPVGSFLPNPFGLYDTVGNVSEWATSFHGQLMPDADGNFPQPRIDARTGVLREKLIHVRGGNFGDDPVGACSCNSSKVSPRNRASHRGLRPVRHWD